MKDSTHLACGGRDSVQRGESTGVVSVDEARDFSTRDAAVGVAPLGSCEFGANCWVGGEVAGFELEGSPGGVLLYASELTAPACSPVLDVSDVADLSCDAVAAAA